MAKILLVDDSRTSRKILRGVLEEAGYEIIGEAKNGVEGVELYKSLSPDIVTMDITMPELDGIGALQMIRQHDPNAKVIMVTAAGQKSKMVQAVKYGASDFLSKPYEPQQVLDIIAKLV